MALATGLGFIIRAGIGKGEEFEQKRKTKKTFNLPVFPHVVPKTGTAFGQNGYKLFLTAITIIGTSTRISCARLVGPHLTIIAFDPVLYRRSKEKMYSTVEERSFATYIFVSKRRMPLPKERMAVVKMQRLTLVNEALSSEIAIKSSVSEPSQRSDHEVSPSTSHTNVCDQPGCSTSRIGCDDLQVELSTSHIEKTLHCDKAVQVNIKPNYRSKGVNALPPNKAVMADRGFKDLSCLLEAKRCTLIRPPSVSKSTPSTKNEVKLSKRIAALRIHVERILEDLSKFCVGHKACEFKIFINLEHKTWFIQ
ncbi:hypothetical protein HW555_012670 [Spodoptera exigua]|uniref:DDE Tnp4 domain-containing protein n=1 Tax=Spodoptera exigua TaxID=7107 RepID=A0A835G4H7_SPOEX|nr:hypothetical protein HW555_012670 [Spodoptera exigua]